MKNLNMKANARASEIFFQLLAHWEKPRPRRKGARFAFLGAIAANMNSFEQHATPPILS
jgi:hypothetical protein